jgi:hypothetical protein
MTDGRLTTTFGGCFYFEGAVVRRRLQNVSISLNDRCLLELAKNKAWAQGEIRCVVKVDLRLLNSMLRATILALVCGKVRVGYKSWVLLKYAEDSGRNGKRFSTAVSAAG